MRKSLYFISLLHIFSLSILFTACTSHPDVPYNAKAVASLPAIYPDYCDVTVPCNIAPLNFMLADTAYTDCVARITTPDGNSETYGDGRKVIIPESEWQDVLNASRGKDVAVEVWSRKGDEWLQFKKFNITVSADSIDGYLSYRLIEPSYLIYDYMEIAQRNLTNFDETVIFNNKIACEGVKGQCINCHSYQNFHTDNMLFHVRANRGGTVLVNDGSISKIDLKRDYTISAGVYPAWHPTEKLIAFSTNTTRQLFHTANPNKTEVFDLASDLVLYDVTKDEVYVVAADTTRLEVFPTWSPDGNYLYYCSTLSDTTTVRMHTKYKNIHYNLYRRTFNAQTLQFGDEELIYDAASIGHSVSLPRISPDGQHIIFAEGAYGCFQIWHHDADITMIDVPKTPLSIAKGTAFTAKAAAPDAITAAPDAITAATNVKAASTPDAVTAATTQMSSSSPEASGSSPAGKASTAQASGSSHAGKAATTQASGSSPAGKGPLALLNSKNYADSYPTWSSNGKWIMCASRRDDGNYSRVYIAYFDGKRACKPFLLPQADPEHNSLRLKSYNRPEFMVEPVKHSIQDFQQAVIKE